MLYLASTRRPQNILLDDKNDTISAENYLRGAIGLINHFANLVKKSAPWGAEWRCTRHYLRLISLG